MRSQCISRDVGDIVAADDGNVVLRLTRDDARAAAGAGAEIDRHRPLVRGLPDAVRDRRS